MNYGPYGTSSNGPGGSGSGFINANNGLHAINPSTVGLGGALIQDTEIDTDNNDFSILSGEFSFNTIPLTAGIINIPRMLLESNNYKIGFYNLTSVGSPSEQIFCANLDLMTGSVVGLTVRELPNTDIFASVSAKEDMTGYEVGFSAHGHTLNNPTADHYVYLQSIQAAIAAIFVRPSGIPAYTAFNITDKDNWTENNFELSEAKGFYVALNVQKVAGIFSEPDTVFQVKDKAITLGGTVLGGVMAVPYGSVLNITVGTSQIAFEGISSGASTINISNSDFPIGSLLMISDVDNKALLNNIHIDMGVGNTINYQSSSSQTASLTTDGVSITIQKITTSKWMVLNQTI